MLAVLRRRVVDYFIYNLHVGTFPVFVTGDWTVLFSFPLFSSKFGGLFVIVWLHFINDET